MLTGLVSNIQKYSLHDGPGIRTTVFLKGCPLDCWWCHNPEGRRFKPEIIILENRCVSCNHCLAACSLVNHESDNGPLPKIPTTCLLCGSCIEVCETGARQLIGRKMSVSEVMKEILSDRMFYEESQGGASFSGGEPLSQPDFLLALLRECRKKGIHTTLDTCGYAPSSVLLKVAREAELILFDLKMMNADLHRKYTGVSNKLILSNLKLLSEQGSKIWVRFPVIPSVNDQGDQITAMIQLIVSLKNIQQVNLLPYHNIGVAKFQRLGVQYRLPEVVLPSSDYMNTLSRIFVQNGISVKIGG